MSSAMKNITGTYDVLPSTTSSAGAHENPVWEWQHVEAVIADVLSRYAFKEIRTPILEPTDLVARGVGEHTDIVSKEMFAFEREGTNYVLRPEVTAPVMRAYLQHNLDQQGGAQKLYYMGSCFRAERPQKGRYRQFNQFGCEVIGSDSAVADAEVIGAMMAIYRAFGLEGMRLRLNTLGDETSRPRYREALQAYFAPYKNDLSETSRRRLEVNPLRILDTKSERERELLAEAPKLSEFIDGESRTHYETLKGLLDDLCVRFVEDPFLVRGLDYYTRTAFELESDDIGAQSALAGGGRYDLLALEVGSKKAVPAVGFAAGMERLLIALAASGYTMPAEQRPDVYLIGLGEAASNWTLSTAQRLRATGLHVELDVQGRSLKAQMRNANRSNAANVVIVGEKEIVAKRAVVKHMDKGEQSEVRFQELDTYLAARF